MVVTIYRRDGQAATFRAPRKAGRVEVLQIEVDVEGASQPLDTPGLFDQVMIIPCEERISLAWWATDVVRAAYMGDRRFRLLERGR